MRYVVLLLLLSGQLMAQNGYVIEGTINLPEGWSPLIYLSTIDRLDDLTSISDDMIFDESEIDSSGVFRFAGDYLPEGDRVYRLHVSKVGDPISTIIIGSKEQNHMHFAMRPGDTIKVFPKHESSLFATATIQGNPINRCIARVDSVITESRQGAGTVAGARIRRAEHIDVLRTTFERCPYALGKLYTAHFLLDRFESEDVVAFLQRGLSLMKLQDSAYADGLQMKAEILAGQYGTSDAGQTSAAQLLWILPLILVIGWLLWRRPWISSKDDPLESLSIQERKVLELLVDGKSNKEISQELNIGISTVKTHVHRIYGKLGIGTRKEVFKFKSALAGA